MTGKLAHQSFGLYAGYRAYVTPEAYVITYRDADLIRVMRRHHDHAPGFVLLLVKLIYLALIGKRTALRERWAVDSAEHEADAHDLNVAQLRTPGSVVEFTVDFGGCGKAAEVVARPHAD